MSDKECREKVLRSRKKRENTSFKSKTKSLKYDMKKFWKNKWFKFFTVAILYTLLFVVWTGNLWLLLGLPMIYDIYISKFMYRAFWKKHQDRKRNNSGYKKAFEWIEAIVFAVIAVTFIRFFLFAMYVIPSSSMEKSLLVGDYLCVSKVAYGPSVPNTPIAFPLVHNTMPFSRTMKSYSELIQWPYHRLKGFGHLERGDVVVFNFPAGDTVVQERANETYYDILRDYERMYGSEAEGRAHLFKDYTIVTHPVDKRENYVKRAIGMPGDTLTIVDAQVLINGAPFMPIPQMQYAYYIQTNGTPISNSALENMGIASDDVLYSPNSHLYMLPLTEANYERVKAMSNVTEIKRYEPYGSGLDYFPNDSLYQWNEDTFGPLWVPKKGATVALDSLTLPLYRRVIDVYEGNDLEVRGTDVFINGKRATTYTFKMDYFFMMGDNRHRSLDSRFWGFVPEDHIVGKASFIWLSIDKDKRFPANIRWSRMFRSVK